MRTVLATTEMPNCRSALTKCKICKGELLIWIDVDCTPQWEAKLMPMATCDRCYDLMERRRVAHAVIGQACWTLHQLSLENEAFMSVKRKAAVKQIREECERSLYTGLTKYLEATAEQVGRKWTLPVDEYVGLFLDRPHKWQDMLRAAKHNAMRLAQ